MTGTGVHPPLQITTMGLVSEADIDDMTATIGPELGRVDLPIRAAHLRLTQATNPAVERPAVAQVTVDVDSHVVRAQVAAANMAAAAELLQARLADKLTRAFRVWGNGHESRAAVDIGQRPPQSLAPSPAPGPGVASHVVRHKAVRVLRESVPEAALDMEMGDYGFFLFVDAVTGADCLLERSGPDTYRLTSAGPAGRALGAGLAVEVSDRRAPRIRVEDAARWLAFSEEPHLFFVDPATSRGTVLYRRYDGHYGLIAPVADEGA